MSKEVEIWGVSRGNAACQVAARAEPCITVPYYRYMFNEFDIAHQK